MIASALMTLLLSEFFFLLIRWDICRKVVGMLNSFCR